NAVRMIIAEAASFEKVKAPESLWESIETQLDAKNEHFLSKILNQLLAFKNQIASSFKRPVPVLQIAGVLAILAIGIVIGRYVFPTVVNDNLTQKAEVQNGEYQIIRSRTNEYVEKSKILFLGIVNADTEEVEKQDWRTEKRIAQHLIKEASFLKDNLSEKRNARIRQLIEELELILLEFANLEAQHDIENIELIKNGIDRQGILLKINLYDLSEQQINPEKIL
ncbi:MAG: hypothetical protein ACE5HI_15860, partial [bacterium]